MKGVEEVQVMAVSQLPCSNSGVQKPTKVPLPVCIVFVVRWSRESATRPTENPSEEMRFSALKAPDESHRTGDFSDHVLLTTSTLGQSHQRCGSAENRLT